MEQKVSHRHNFEVELFLEPQFAESFKCAICKFIPHPDASYNHAKCGALFCKLCLDTWMKKRRECPKCGGTIAPRLTKTHNHLVYELHQKLNLKCSSGEKCDWRGRMELLGEHQLECKFTATECKYSVAGCSFEGTCEQLAKHYENEKNSHIELCLDTIHVLKFGSKLKKNEEEKKKPEEGRKVLALKLKDTEAMIEKEKRELLIQKERFMNLQSRLKDELNSRVANPNPNVDANIPEEDIYL